MEKGHICVDGVANQMMVISSGAKMEILWLELEDRR